ncbi:hypothetical protein SAMN05661091_5024 [Paenibacillus uliginis N3/975]|uniref:Dolichyl-phosphate-mannose-protein mannosyltransferase n=1 Tax=Paenibacillus uliginis N3/975 TaxID=1313296 RepID=A0A1X7HRA4_9BACL|nr:hypothetical protein [Paenibacillus uliginis]SMF90405.1 hypothetical protein SAMN05661091_5024 [Paenibacillus uliginis N3/975]
MLIMLQLLMGVLLVFSFLGYLLIVRKTLSLQWEFIPVFVFSSIACIVFFSGLAGQLFMGSLAVMVLGLLAFVVIAFLWLRQGASFRISFSISQLCFLVGSFIFLLVLFQNKLTHYDNFSHWAIVLKQMLSTDAFPTPDSNLIDFKNYPLGVSSFLYYVCRFAGHSQSVMLLAQGLLIFSCFYAMFGIVSEKKRFLLYAFLGLGLSTLSFFNITIRITNLLVDFLLPIYALAILAVVYQYRNDMKRACIVVLPLVGLLTVVKSTGIIFAAIGLIFLVYTWLTHGQKSGWKPALAVVGTICGALIPYFGWSWRMATVFQGVDNKFDVAASGLQIGKTPEQMREIISLFLRSSTDLTTRPVIGIVIFHLVAIAASVFAVVVLKKKWNLWKALIALDIVLLLYYAGILALYLYSMPLDEAIRLAGFERYASSIVVLFAGGLVLCAAIDLERSFHYKIGEVPDYRAFKSFETKGYYQKGIIACIAIAATILLSEYNGIVSIAKSYDTTLPHKIYAVTGDRWYKGGQEDNHRYLFYASDRDQQVTNYYMQYVGKYFLYAPKVDGIVLFYEDNMDNLLSGYDYLVVVETDSDAKRLLKKHYGVDMQEGIYKITRSGDQIVLTLQ